MLIRSQNRKSLFNLITSDGVWINKYEEEFVTINADTFGELGEYSSEEKAIKVLDMIQKFYNKCFAFTMENDGCYHEVSENKVFQMPLDEEVEG